MKIAHQSTFLILFFIFFQLAILTKETDKLQKALNLDNLDEAIETFVSTWKNKRKSQKQQNMVAATKTLTADSMIGDDPTAVKNVQDLFGTGGSGSLKAQAESTVKDSVILFHSNSSEALNLRKNPSNIQKKLHKLLPSDVAIDMTSNSDGSDKQLDQSALIQNSNQRPSNARVKDAQSKHKNCSMCFQRDMHKKWRLDAIKLQILRKLRLTKPPNVTGIKLPKIPLLNRLIRRREFQADDSFLYRTKFRHGKYSNKDAYEFHATTLKVITFAQKMPEYLGINNADACYIILQPQVLHSKITRANLWIYIHPERKKNKKNTKINIEVYRILRSSKTGGGLLRQKVRSRRTTRNGGWHKFDLKSIVQSWVNTGHNYGLQIFAIDGNKHSVAVVQPKTEDEEQYKPFIEIRIQEKGPARRKRNPGLNCDETSMEDRCCRYPLTVDFTEFDWDWVIAPKRYQANFCSGECPPVFLQKRLHTHMVTQANPLGFDGPCCTPTKLSSMSLLYFDDKKNILYGVLPGIVVDSCGCQ